LVEASLSNFAAPMKALHRTGQESAWQYLSDVAAKNLKFLLITDTLGSPFGIANNPIEACT
jgi:hypothetical protein